jgi:hypothetical protein
MHYTGFPFSPTLAFSSFAGALATPKPLLLSKLPPPVPEFHVGPIISWPFFGSNRGDLNHPTEINRGPWTSSHAYFESCVEREVNAVIRENEGKAAPHKLHLDPGEIMSSRHHHLRAVPGDESDESDEWDLEESEAEWDGPGDQMYRDYRRMQRGTFLVAHLEERAENVRVEMMRWQRLMDRLVAAVEKGNAKDGEDVVATEQFGLDCHDLSLDNIFVDANDHHKIVCLLPSVLPSMYSLNPYRLVSSTGNPQLPAPSGPAPTYPHSSNPAPSPQNSSARS